ncbi:MULTISPECIES: hypothetical protein [Sphingomonas]|uniref:hypothetical protein n=1 Tax=Sphingomonas TaxID=13687 RepID=UPI000DEFBE9F|nr:MULTISPECIES: hypothetical protein [Sphingomonas]
MKLGVWLRLAIVLTGLWLVIAPVWMSASEREKQFTTAFDLYKACSQNAWEPYDAKRIAGCENDKQILLKSATDAPLYVEALGVCAVLAVMVWLLGLIAYGLVRWILRGREV